MPPAPMRSFNPCGTWKPVAAAVTGFESFILTIGAARADLGEANVKGKYMKATNNMNK